VGRWKSKCSEADVRLCEALVGPFLEELGYVLAYPEERDAMRLRAYAMRTVYVGHLTLKHWLKTHTPLGRVMIRTRAWAQQPRAGERLQFPVAQPAVAAQHDR
jgi:hypothetical protein